MSPSSVGHRDVDAGRAQVGDQQVAGVAAKGQLARRPAAGAVAEPGVAHQAEVDQLAHALRDDRAAEARSRDELGARARPAQPDLVENGDE